MVAALKEKIRLVPRDKKFYSIFTGRVFLREESKMGATTSIDFFSFGLDHYLGKGQWSEPIHNVPAATHNSEFVS